MATLYYGVKGSSGQDMTVELSISDDHAPRILAWLMSPNSGYGTVSENVQNGDYQEWVTRPATPQEAATAYARAMLNSLLSFTVAWEQAQAAAAAASAVKPIEVA